MLKRKLESVRIAISDYEFILALSFQEAGKVLHDLIVACKHGQTPCYKVNREAIEECEAHIKWKAMETRRAKNA